MSEKRIVHTTTLFKVDDKFDDERFMRVRIAALHSGVNLNNSDIPTDAIKSAKNSFANIPILADIVVYTDEDGNQHLDYAGHDMHLEDDAFNKDKQRIIYDEKVVGIIPESNNFEIVHDEETGNDYAYVDGLIYRDYGNYCADILEERGGTTSVSAELNCNEISYSNKKKCLSIKDFTMCGITLLGETVRPAMQKANATMFSMDDNDRQAQMERIMKELTQALNNYTATINQTILRKEEKESMTKFEELLQKYNVTAEDVKFEYENLSDDELEAKFQEVFGEEEEVTGTLSENEEVENESEEKVSEEFEDTSDSSNILENEDSDESDETENDSENIDSTDNYTLQCSMQIGEDKVEFASSLSDILFSLTQLVNSQYEVDGTWYSVDAYTEPSKYVVMQDICSGRAYKQGYKVRKDEYQLVGDRIEVFSQFLTADEITELDNMRKNYSEVTEKLSKYESEPEKIEVLGKEDYSSIFETDEYKELSKRENYFNLSKEEVEGKLDEILLSYAKQKKLDFSAKNENDEKESEKGKMKTLFGYVPILNGSNGRTSRYGNLFNKN